MALINWINEHDCGVTPDVLYRYENHADVVLLNSYHVVKLTPCGAWIQVYAKPRFVKTTAVKRFACESKEDAKTSFLARKRRQLAILKVQIEGVNGAVLALNEGRIADYANSMFQLDY